MSKLLTALYFVVLATEIFADLSDITPIVYLTKPLLMPLLMLGYYLSVPGKLNRFDIFMLLSLFFSLGGDTFLMFRLPGFFVYGLASFLLAHVFYVLLFNRSQRFQWVRSLPFCLYSLSFLAILWNSLPGDLLLPVVVYGLVIALMGVWAVNRDMPERSYYLVLGGAVSFIVSDSLIAFGRFVHEIPLSSFWVMTIYGLAQYLIVEGVIAGKVNKKGYETTL